MGKKHIGLLLCIASLILIGCSKSESVSNPNLPDNKEIKTPQVAVIRSVEEPTKSITPMKIKEQDWETKQKDSILQQHPKYRNYPVHTYKLENIVIAFYESPDADQQDWMNYYGDIWAYGKDWVTQVEENVYILPDTYGIDQIDGKEYFRYDRSYVTESVTVLLMLDDKENLRLIGLPGALDVVNGNDMTVIGSHYDMVYLKADQYTVGHTWKPYYYYLKDYEIIEYAAEEISKDEVLQYSGAKEIIEQLTKDYSKPDKQLHMIFLKRENGLIHINLMVESKDDITFYYETYNIRKNQSLERIGQGEGTYASLDSLSLLELMNID